MNANSGSGSAGTFVWGLVVGLVAVASAGGLYLSGMFGSGSDQVAPDLVEVVRTPEPEAEPAPAPGEESADQTAKAAPANEGLTASAVQAPVLDQIFVEPDGNAVLSGIAEPGAEIDILLDGNPVHSFTVDDSGQFAEFLRIPFADAARGLALQMQGDGGPVRSDDYLIAALPEPAEPVQIAPETKGPDVDVAQVDATPETDVARAGTDLRPAEPEVDTAEPEAVPAPETPAPEIAETRDTEIAGGDPQAAGTAVPEPEVSEPSTGGTTDQRVTILRSGEEGVELVQPSIVADVPPRQIALDTIGYSDTGDVELTGRTQDGSAVRLYLNNRLVADLPPAPGGQWRGEVAGIDPGVYTLRVEEIAPDGTVVSRLETPFKREPVEALRAAEDIAQRRSQDAVPPIRSVTVQQGDTLWAISRERFGDGVLYVRLFEANKDAIRDPDLIFPGQVFTIPE